MARHRRPQPHPFSRPARGPRRPTAKVRVPDIGTATSEWDLWSTTARVVVTDQEVLAEAVRLAKELCADVGMACSRFRTDSEIIRLRPELADGCEVSDTLAGIVRGALAAAQETAGTVDPTVGNMLLTLGYDRDFRLVAAADRSANAAPTRSPDEPPFPTAGTLGIRTEHRISGWTRIRLEGNRLTVPDGVLLDLGAIGKALAADWAAAKISSTLGCGTMVSLGGDLATAGLAPAPGWTVLVQDLPSDPAPTVRLEPGYALATSSTQKRRWTHVGNPVHHIIDPRTGLPAEAIWRTVTVAAISCAEANAVSTSCIVRGHAALPWLRKTGHPARLVDNQGRILTLGGWPEDRQGFSHECRF